MRIVYLHQYFRTPDMSGGTRSYEMARRWVAAGHEVHMVTADTERLRSSARPVKDSVSGILVHWLPVEYSNHMSNAQRMKAFWEFAVRSAKVAWSLNPDVVYATSTPLTVVIPGILTSRLRRVPMVLEVRDLWPEIPIALGDISNPLARKAAELLETFAYLGSRHIVALSPDMRDGVVAKGVDQRIVSVVPNSCDFDLFSVPLERGQAFRSRHAWIGTRPLVLYAGTIGKVNGVSYLVQIAAAMRAIDTEIRFLIVGNGREEAVIRSEAERLGVLNVNLQIWPAMPKREIVDVFSAADITVSTVINVEALWPNSANKLFDSLASGTPIMINHGGWQADLVRETEIGLVVPPDDPPSAARQLADRLRDCRWLRQASRNAGMVGRERFDRDTLASTIEAILVDVTS